MRAALSAIGMAIRERPIGWLAISLGSLVIYYTGLLASMIVQFDNWPNYVNHFDWLGNVARIFSSTPSLSDAVQIAREEWLFEVGYLNTDFGHGISEWSLTLVPEKMLMILIMSMILATVWALNSVRRRSCIIGEGGATFAATGFGAGLVGLTMLGLSVATANWLEPIGIWINILGFSLLALTTFIVANRVGNTISAQSNSDTRPDFAYTAAAHQAR